MTENISNMPVAEAAETKAAAEAVVDNKFLDLATDIKLDVAAVKAEIERAKGLTKFVEEDKFNLSKALKSLNNAEKLIGKRIEEADAETIKALTNKFDVPEVADEYEITADEAAAEKVKAFKEMAKEIGIPKHIAQKLYEKLNADNAVENEKAKIEANLKAINEMFGAELETKKAAANRVVDMFGDDGLKEYIAKSGLGTEPQFLKFLAQVGEKFTTRDLAPERPVEQKTTAEEAIQKIAAIRNSEEYRKALKNTYGKEYAALHAKLRVLYEQAGQ